MLIATIVGKSVQSSHKEDKGRNIFMLIIMIVPTHENRMVIMMVIMLGITGIGWR